MQIKTIFWEKGRGKDETTLSKIFSHIMVLFYNIIIIKKLFSNKLSFLGPEVVISNKLRFQLGKKSEFLFFSLFRGPKIFLIYFKNKYLDL